MNKPLKLCYRADFQQPLGVLNQLNIKLPHPVTVELRKSAGAWVYCRPGAPKDCFEIAWQTTAEAAKKALPGPYFEKQLTEWQAFELTEPNGYAVPIPAEQLWIDPKTLKAYRIDPSAAKTAQKGNK